MKNLKDSALMWEMNVNEMKEVNGGIHWLVASIAFAFVWDTLNDLEGTANACASGRDRALSML